MPEEAKTLPTIGYSGVIAVPKRPGRGRNDQDSETWLHSGHILLHHIETKTQKTHGSKIKLRAAVKTGLKILVSEHPESMKQQAVTELNQLKYALGGYWKQWLASIRHQKFEVKNRTTITFNLEPELQKLLGFEHFNEKAMNTLNMMTHVSRIRIAEPRGEPRVGVRRFGGLGIWGLWGIRGFWIYR